MVYSGGLIYWADTIGSKYIYTSLKKWSEKYGGLFKPSEFLEERAAKGIALVKILGPFGRAS